MNIWFNELHHMIKWYNGLVQDCSISIANAMGILQSCTKLLISWYYIQHSKDDVGMTHSPQCSHNERDGVTTNHWCFDCLLNHLFRCTSKKTSKLHVTDVCEGNPTVTGGPPHKGPVMRKMFPFDDVISMLNVNENINKLFLELHWICLLFDMMLWSNPILVHE